MKLEYSSNNSGGNWWLDDEDWMALEQAGWVIEWFKDRDDAHRWYKDGRFLGALAANASKNISSKEEATAAVEEWERITHNSVTDTGCNCCGQPHYFTLCDDEGNYISSFGISPTYVEYEREWS